MLRITAAIFFTAFTITSFAGGLALVEDYENKLFIFDKGQFTQLEHNKAQQIHVGRHFAAYIDYMNNLKVWHNGQLKTIDRSMEQFNATEELITWKIANYLYVWDDGIKKEISRDARLVKVNGGLIFFEDEYDNALKIYYNHKVYYFAENHYSLKARALDIGRGSVAVQDGSNQLFIFVKGDMQVKKYTEDQLLFSAGNNGVIVLNNDTDELELVKGDDVEVMDYFPARWFKSDYQWHVWVDQTGNFYLWENGQKELLTYQKPAVIEFSPENFLYENGYRLYSRSLEQEFMVCDHIPENYSFYNNLFVFYNRQNNVELVDNGNYKVISNMPGVQFELFFDTVVLKEGQKRKVYYKGDIYNL